MSPDLRPVQLDRSWTVYLLHHSHTDIGYTETQRRIEKRHADFTEQALRLVASPAADGFVWNNECHWALERWWREATPSRRDELAAAVHADRFGVSGNYLHFNEMVDDHVLRRSLERAQAFGREIGAAVDTAMHADINGFGWGHSQALYDAGVRNLMMLLHPVHGVAPLDRRQLPFWWETPRGDALFVWLGEHYNLGNVLGLCPRGHLTYTFKDEWFPKQAAEDGGLMAATRLPRYLRQLELDGYPGRIVPIAISGTASDNAPPNAEIARFAREWNATHGDQIYLEMTTTARFMGLAREHFAPFPTYRGDWPDWWSDGYASQPDEVRLCRQAQRDYGRARALAGYFDLRMPDGARERLEQGIALYTEHTFGHADSVLTPWEAAVKLTAGTKRRYALDAAEASEEILDALEAQRGALPLVPDRPFVFRVVNAGPTPIRDVVRLYLEGPDFGTRDLECVVKDLATGASLPCQKMSAPRGVAWGVWLDLPPHGTRDLEMQEGLATLSRATRNCTDFVHLGLTLSDTVGAEGPPVLCAGRETLESPHVRIAWSLGGEITSWIDKKSGRDLLSPGRTHGAFTPVYERTPVTPPNSPEAQLQTRGRFGRNRKGANVVRSSGHIVSAEPLGEGPLFSSVQLNYALDGCTLARLILTAWRDAPRVDATLQIHKDSVWDPENLYLSLPFTSGEAAETLWIDKPGAPVRPGIDQLPGSLTDFYTMQAGFALSGAGYGVAVASPDAPLLQLGDLAHGPRLLMGAPALADRPLRPYGWLLSNFWETNFEASVGGFHEFRYRVEAGPHLAAAEDALRQCHALNDLPSVFRV